MFWRILKIWKKDKCLGSGLGYGFVSVSVLLGPMHSVTCQMMEKPRDTQAFSESLQGRNNSLECSMQQQLPACVTPKQQIEPQARNVPSVGAFQTRQTSIPAPILKSEGEFCIFGPHQLIAPSLDPREWRKIDSDWSTHTQVQTLYPNNGYQFLIPAPRKQSALQIPAGQKYTPLVAMNKAMVQNHFKPIKMRHIPHRRLLVVLYLSPVPSIHTRCPAKTMQHAQNGPPRGPKC